MKRCDERKRATAGDHIGSPLIFCACRRGRRSYDRLRGMACCGARHKIHLRRGEGTPPYEFIAGFTGDRGVKRRDEGIAPYGEAQGEISESRAEARLFFMPVALDGATKGGKGMGNREVKRMDEIAAECDICGFEIYRGETCYRVNGETICEDCLGEFAVRLLAPFRMGGND